MVRYKASPIRGICIACQSFQVPWASSGDPANVRAVQNSMLYLFLRLQHPSRTHSIPTLSEHDTLQQSTWIAHLKTRTMDIAPNCHAAQAEGPPSYQAITESDSIEKPMDRIIQQTFTRGAHSAENVSNSRVKEVAWFLIDVLAIDYDPHNTSSLDVARRRSKYRTTRCSLNWIHRFYVPGPASGPVVQSTDSNHSFGNMYRNFYAPARKLGILPCAIDTVLHRYFKHTPYRSDGRYTGCVQDVYQELGVDSLAEKISWDWIHLLKPLEEFRDSARGGWNAEIQYKSIFRTARKLLPLGHSTRYMLEHIVLKSAYQPSWRNLRAGVKAQWISEFNARPGLVVAKELRELLCQADRWLLFTDPPTRTSGGSWLTRFLA